MAYVVVRIFSSSGDEEERRRTLCKSRTENCSPN